MECGDTIFSRHAIARMFERSLTPAHVRAVIRDGEVVADYASDRPHPSRLLLSYIEGRPVHVVVAKDEQAGTCIVVTAYEPDPALWDETFTRRLVP
ncbi:DUF4258 domain-containing protein [Salinisphaera sp.]|uniref:DUF4258 domain-containing protein n=1 Tax=Salinisphaera sp. TaxID=1914330 RepID=UPI0032C220E6